MTNHSLGQPGPAPPPLRARHTPSPLGAQTVTSVSPGAVPSVLDPSLSPVPSVPSVPDPPPPSQGHSSVPDPSVPAQPLRPSCATVCPALAVPGSCPTCPQVGHTAVHTPSTERVKPRPNKLHSMGAIPIPAFIHREQLSKAWISSGREGPELHTQQGTRHKAGDEGTRQATAPEQGRGRGG